MNESNQIQCYSVSSDDVNVFLDMVANASLLFAFIGVIFGFIFAFLLFGSLRKRRDIPPKMDIQERYYMAKAFYNPAFHKAVLLHLESKRIISAAR